MTERPSPPPHDHREQKSVPKVETIEVIRVTFPRGQGCCEESRARRVVAYYLTNGTLITEEDPG